MKRTRKLLTLIIAVCITSSLFSCNSRAAQEASTPTQADKIIAEDSYSARIDYYSSLVTELQEQLLNIKEENYIEKQKYILKIEELEKLLSLLNDKFGSVAVSGSGQEDISSAVEDDTVSEISLKPKFEYSISNREIAITKYVGNDTDVTIPSYIDGCPVSAIGEDAFKGSSVRSVSLSQGIKKIDWFAFSECFALTDVFIPSSVTFIGYGAFELCSSSLLIVCEKGSYAEAYAKSWGMQTEITK
jgi:hypothetical protein